MDGLPVVKEVKISSLLKRWAQRCGGGRSPLCRGEEEDVLVDEEKEDDLLIVEELDNHEESWVVMADADVKGKNDDGLRRHIFVFFLLMAVTCPKSGRR